MKTASCITLHNSRGGVLLGVVAALVMGGILGAGAASMVGTSALHGVRANYGEQAYYLAESGYNYAYSTLKSGGDSAFWALDGETISAPGGGTFTLQLSNLSEDLDYDPSYGVSGAQTIASGDNIDIQSGATLAPKNGMFLHDGSWYRYLEFRSGENKLTNIIAAAPHPWAVNGNQTISSGGDLLLQSGAVVPSSDGTFTYGGISYSYDSLEGGELKNITSDDPDAFPLEPTDGEQLSFPAKFPLVLADNDPLEFAAITQVQSTGEFPGTGDMNVARTVTYWFYDADASGVISGGEESEFSGDGVEVDSDLVNFIEAGGGGNALGAYGEVVEDGATALQVENMNPGGQHPMTSLMYGGISSPDYEVQVKIKINPSLTPMDYMAGITFRIQGDENNPGQLGAGLYGVSLLKGPYPRTNGPPDTLTIGTNNLPVMALWKLTGNPQNTNPIRLAWEYLGGSIFDSDGRLEDWTTLLVRVQQKSGEGGDYNQITAMYGDHVLNATVGDNDPYNDNIRQSSSRGGVEIDGSTQLPWPPNDFADWSADLDYFTVKLEGEEDSTYLFKSDAVAEIGLHTWGQNLAQTCGGGKGKGGKGGGGVCTSNVFFDDFSFREGTAGGGGGLIFGGGYLPPIQQ